MPIASLRHEEENPDWHRSNPLVNKSPSQVPGKYTAKRLYFDYESRVERSSPLAATITSMSYSSGSTLNFSLH